MMAEFWANHFVPGSLGEDSPEWFPSDMSRYEYFYRNATGNVRQMIERFICSVSLQHFMTNYLNTASSKNENLGREVLELFGLGLADVDEPPRYDPVFDVLSLTDVLTGHGVRVCPMGLKIDNDADFRQPNLLLQGTTGLQTFYEDDGVTPLAGGKVYFYQPGSTTVAKTVWSNRQKTIAHPNPIVLNGNGQANIFGTGLHAIRVFNSSDVLQYEIINPQSWVGTQHETYWFDATKHDGDAVTFTFLPGVTFSNAVDGAGTTGYGMHPSLTKFLDQLIASRPSARFFVTKIAKFFIGKAPTAAVREALIDKYLEAIDDDDQIAQVLLLLFQTEDFCGTYADNERAMTPLMWWSKLASFFGDDTPHISGGFQLLDRIHEFVETDEGYYTGRYQSPNGYPDTPDHWLSPGNLTGRAFRTNTLTATGVSSTSNYKTKFGFSAPNDFIAFVNVNFLGSRATGAQLDALRASFTNRSINVSNPLNNWSTNSVRAAIREVLNTLPILDIAMLSE
jgi:uncharacterized protein (DUF1800 family)